MALRPLFVYPREFPYHLKKGVTTAATTLLKESCTRGVKDVEDIETLIRICFEAGRLVERTSLLEMRRLDAQE